MATVKDKLTGQVAHAAKRGTFPTRLVRYHNFKPPEPAPTRTDARELDTRNLAAVWNTKLPFRAAMEQIRGALNVDQDTHKAASHALSGLQRLGAMLDEFGFRHPQSVKDRIKTVTAAIRRKNKNALTPYETDFMEAVAQRGENAPSLALWGINKEQLETTIFQLAKKVDPVAYPRAQRVLDPDQFFVYRDATAPGPDGFGDSSYLNEQPIGAIATGSFPSQADVYVNDFGAQRGARGASRALTPQGLPSAFLRGRDPIKNAGVSGAPTPNGHVEGARWQCCGNPLDHPGCWARPAYKDEIPPPHEPFLALPLVPPQSANEATDYMLKELGTPAVWDPDLQPEQYGAVYDKLTGVRDRNTKVIYKDAIGNVTKARRDGAQLKGALEPYQYRVFRDMLQLEAALRGPYGPRPGQPSDDAPAATWKSFIDRHIFGLEQAPVPVGGKIGKFGVFAELQAAVSALDGFGPAIEEVKKALEKLKGTEDPKVEQLEKDLKKEKEKSRRLAREKQVAEQDLQRLRQRAASTRPAAADDLEGQFNTERKQWVQRERELQEEVDTLKAQNEIFENEDDPFKLAVSTYRSLQWEFENATISVENEDGFEKELKETERQFEELQKRVAKLDNLFNNLKAEATEKKRAEDALKDAKSAVDELRNAGADLRIVLDLITSEKTRVGKIRFATATDLQARLDSAFVIFDDAVQRASERLENAGPLITDELVALRELQAEFDELSLLGDAREAGAELMRMYEYQKQQNSQEDAIDQLNAIEANARDLVNDLENMSPEGAAKLLPLLREELNKSDRVDAKGDTAVQGKKDKVQETIERMVLAVEIQQNEALRSPSAASGESGEAPRTSTSREDVKQSVQKSAEEIRATVEKLPEDVLKADELINASEMMDEIAELLDSYEYAEGAIQVARTQQERHKAEINARLLGLQGAFDDLVDAWIRRAVALLLRKKEEGKEELENAEVALKEAKNKYSQYGWDGAKKNEELLKEMDTMAKGVDDLVDGVEWETYKAVWEAKAAFKAFDKEHGPDGGDYSYMSTEKVSIIETRISDLLKKITALPDGVWDTVAPFLVMCGMVTNTARTAGRTVTSWKYGESNKEPTQVVDDVLVFKRSGGSGVVFVKTGYYFNDDDLKRVVKMWIATFDIILGAMEIPEEGKSRSTTVKKRIVLRDHLPATYQIALDYANSHSSVAYGLGYVWPVDNLRTKARVAGLKSMLKALGLEVDDTESESVLLAKVLREWLIRAEAVETAYLALSLGGIFDPADPRPDDVADEDDESETVEVGGGPGQMEEQSEKEKTSPAPVAPAGSAGDSVKAALELLSDPKKNGFLERSGGLLGEKWPLLWGMKSAYPDATIKTNTEGAIKAMGTVYASLNTGGKAAIKTAAPAFFNGDGVRHPERPTSKKTLETLDKQMRDFTRIAKAQLTGDGPAPEEEEGEKANTSPAPAPVVVPGADKQKEEGGEEGSNSNSDNSTGTVIKAALRAAIKELEEAAAGVFIQVPRKRKLEARWPKFVASDRDAARENTKPVYAAMKDVIGFLDTSRVRELREFDRDTEFIFNEDHGVFDSMYWKEGKEDDPSREENATAWDEKPDENAMGQIQDAVRKIVELAREQLTGKDGGPAPEEEESGEEKSIPGPVVVTPEEESKEDSEEYQTGTGGDLVSEEENEETTEEDDEYAGPFYVPMVSRVLPPLLSAIQDSGNVTDEQKAKYVRAYTEAVKVYVSGTRRGTLQREILTEFKSVDGFLSLPGEAQPEVTFETRGNARKAMGVVLYALGAVNSVVDGVENAEDTAVLYGNIARRIAESGFENKDEIGQLVGFVEEKLKK